MRTECVIKPFYRVSSGGGTDIWIVYEGRRYYSRINYIVHDSNAARNQLIEQFHRRRRAW